MTDTIDAVTADEVVDQQQLAEQLLAQARTQGIDLVGPGGLLNQITKRVLEAAVEAEMSEHLGYDKHDYFGRNGGNSRNGVRPKTVLTEIGPVQIDVPGDIDASFDPQIVRKRQRRSDRRRAGPGGAVRAGEADGRCSTARVVPGSMPRDRQRWQCRRPTEPAMGKRSRVVVRLDIPMRCQGKR